MTKYLAETTGEFQLVDPYDRDQVVWAHRPTVIKMTPFIQARVALEQIKIINELEDAATDPEFDAYWKDSEDETLAVSAFLSTFGVLRETEKVTTKPAAKGRKKAAE